MADATFAGLSITGRCRSVNEDAWGALPAHGVFVVADGCGGLSSGRLAADLAVAATERALARPFTIEPLAAAIAEASEAIRAAAVGPQRGMGAALVALRLAPPWVITASVGDCRIYQVRAGKLTRLTTEDELWLDLLRGGASFDDARAVHENHAGVITQALGYNAVHIRVQYSEMRPGDLYLLCSDGVTKQLTDAEIAAFVLTDAPLAERCGHLLQATDAAGGRDNATAVLVHASAG